MEITKTKKNIIIVGILLLLIIGILGVSYAVFNYTGRGERVNTITTGAISMSYEETDNIITIDGALPTTDATGTKRLKEGEYFDFTISSEITGNTNINYEISAKEVGEGTIDGSNIKLYLTKLTDDNSEEELMEPEVYNEETSENEWTGRPSNEMSLYANSMSSSESNRYRLRMYVDENYNPQGDGGGLTFSVRINVYGKSGDKMPMQTGPANEILLNQDNIGENGSTYDDGVDTFITGEDPNNYIWYSGKLWRAVSTNNEDKTTKLVTQWNISTVRFGITNFVESNMRTWLNDTSTSGFLGTLRDYENFVVTDATWDSTLDTSDLGSFERPNGISVSQNAVGLLNLYEYQSSGGANCYLNNRHNWWTLTQYDDSGDNDSGPRFVNNNGFLSTYSKFHGYEYGVRPSINLKSDVQIVSGNGTATDPYRLEGDNDINLSGTLLNTRYSGEYIRFGNNENNLYRIVSHETPGLTKITSADPLKSGGSYIERNYGSTGYFSPTSGIGSYLNGTYLTSGEFLTSEQVNMIEENSTWGTSNINATVGLLRNYELMAGQFYGPAYWTFNGSKTQAYYVSREGTLRTMSLPGSYSIKPALNLKSNVIITSGDGTKENPFEIALQ